MGVLKKQVKAACESPADFPHKSSQKALQMVSIRTPTQPSSASTAAGIPVDQAEADSLAARLPFSFINHVPLGTKETKVQLTEGLAGSVGITVIQLVCQGDPLFVAWGVVPPLDRVKLVPNDPWLDVVWELSEKDRKEIARMFLSDPKGKALGCRPENLTHTP